MTPVYLPIFFNTEETLKLAEIGMPIAPSKYEKKDMLFFAINAISPGFTPEKSCFVYSEGVSFECAQPYAVVCSLILSKHNQL